MTLIKSIAGVRGTIDTNDFEGLSTKEIIKCVDQFVSWLFKKYFNQSREISREGPHGIILIGRDGRKSGERISSLISERLRVFSFHVLDLGNTTTPSVQMAILTEHGIGGIMISASHNPGNWNGLKLLNVKGEFLSKKESEEVFNSEIKISIRGDRGYTYGKFEQLSTGWGELLSYKEKHISSVLNLPQVDLVGIPEKKFKIVVDGINSSGGIYVPYLLKKLGVEVIELNCICNGEFSHDPEPIPENLTQLSDKVKETKADMGIAVDPDVDRLVFVCEDGSFFGEEYTIVAVVKYILTGGSMGQTDTKVNVVSNLSTTQAVRDVVHSFGGQHFESAVGEINVVELMKEKKAIIGGEGSGGVIFGPLHYGRDALVGIALFLSYLVKVNLSLTELKMSLPSYFMLKEKVFLPEGCEFDYDSFLSKHIKICKQNNQRFLLVDGIKIFYPSGWVHIRKSNTEPLIRLIIESNNKEQLDLLKKTLINDIKNYLI